MSYKKVILGLSLAVVIVGAAATASAGFAQTEDPPTCPANPGFMFPWGRRGTPAGEDGWRTGQDAGVMHEAMIEAFAKALELDPAELEAMLESGETMMDVALAQGLAEEDAWEIMQVVREDIRAELLESGIELPGWGERMQGKMPFSCDGECAMDGGFPHRGGRWGGFAEGRFTDS